MIANQSEMSAFLGISSSELIDGASLVMATYGQIPYGELVLMCGIVLFAYSTIIGWQYYGNRCLTYHSEGKGLWIYKTLYLIVGFFGALGVGDIL